MQLITAEEARTMSDKKQAEKLEQDCMEIRNLIQKAINIGEYDITLYYSLRKEIVDELKRLGYVVECASYMNESVTRISWKGEEK